MSAQKFSNLASIFTMMEDSDCSTLKCMLQYSLKLEPNHEVKEILLELIGVLEGRGTWSKVYMDDQTLDKNVSDLIERTHLLKDVLLLKFDRKYKSKVVKTNECEPEILEELIKKDLIGKFCILVTGEMMQPFMPLFPKLRFFCGTFDVVKFNRQGQIHGKNLIANGLEMGCPNLSGVVTMKGGQFMGFQRRITWARS